MRIGRLHSSFPFFDLCAVSIVYMFYHIDQLMSPFGTYTTTAADIVFAEPGSYLLRQPFGR